MLMSWSMCSRFCSVARLASKASSSAGLNEINRPSILVANKILRPCFPRIGCTLRIAAELCEQPGCRRIVAGILCAGVGHQQLPVVGEESAREVGRDLCRRQYTHDIGV